jgi:hypothetical protein
MNPSLCIPKIYGDYSSVFIRETILKLNFGHIHRIDIVNRTDSNGNKYRKVFIHYLNWYNNVSQIKEELLNGKDYKVVFNDPWFWKILISQVPKPNFP